MLVGDKLNTKKLFVVLECLNDRAFDSADCLRSFIMNQMIRPSYASHQVSCGMLTKVCKARINLFETFVFSPLSTHGVKPYFHRM